MKRKASKIDYSKAFLPRKRREQFKDCFKMNFSTLIKVGMMMFVSIVPMIAFSLFMDMLYGSLVRSTEEGLRETLLIWHYGLNAGLILLSLVASLGLTGSIRILRNMIWGEGIYFKQDFFGAIKENGGKNVLFTLIFSLFYGAALFVFISFADTVVAYVSMLLFVAILFPIYLWIIFLNNVYDSKFFVLVRNGFFFYIKTIGWSILGSIVILLPVTFILVPIDFLAVKYGVMSVLMIFFYPTVLLIMSLYSAAKFDQYINKDQFEDYYHKGLNAD